MALETATYIDGLVTTNPTGLDPKSQGDDHIRLLKSTIKATLPNITGAVTANQGELNILDGATLSTAELNVLDGVTASTAELNILDGVTATAAELNVLDGITSSTAELNILDGVTVTAGDLNTVTTRALKAGDTYTGAHDFTGATLNAATPTVGDSTTKVATTAFVAATSFASALPSQSGNAGKFVTTNGTDASWADAVTPTGVQTLTNKTLTAPESTGAIYDNGSVRGNIVAMGALDIDCSAGNYFTKTINGASTFTVSNVPSSRAFAFTLELTHTSGTVTWFSGVEWPGGVAPSLVTGKTHLFVFVTDDGGTRWRGVANTNYTN